MGEQVLSQEEIDALLGAMAKGEVDLEPEDHKVDKIDESEIETYDLTSNRIVLQNQFYALEEVNDKLTKFMQDYFTTSLQQEIEVKFISTDMINSDKLLQGFSSPSSFHIFTMEPLLGSALLVIEPGLVFSLIDCMFGGDGKPLPNVRDFTLIEMRLMSKMSVGILNAYDTAWRLLYSVKTELKKSETNPEYIHLFNSNELVLSQIFSISGEKFSGNIHFCMSYLMLEPIKEILSSRRINENEVDHYWDNQIKHLMNDAYVNITAELGKSIHTIRELMKMQVGDVLPLNSGPNHPIRINVENVPKFMGYPGVVNGSRAVEISKQILKKGGSQDNGNARRDNQT